MTIDTVEKMEAMAVECEYQIKADGNKVWSDCYNALRNAIEYQKAKQEAALRKAYGGHG